MKITILLSSFIIITIIAVIIIIRQLGVEILLLLTIARDWFSLCLLFFLFSYARGNRTTEKDGDGRGELSLIEIYMCFPSFFFTL